MRWNTPSTSCAARRRASSRPSSSCPSDHPSANQPREEPAVSVNKDAIEAHYAAGDAGDLQGMLAPFAPDIIWTEAAGFPLAGTYIGPAAVAENVFGALQRDWDGY